MQSLFGNCKKQDTLEDATSERHTPNDKYQKFVTAHLEAAAECISNKPITKSSPSKRKVILEALRTTET